MENRVFHFSEILEGLQKELETWLSCAILNRLRENSSLFPANNDLLPGEAVKQLHRLNRLLLTGSKGDLELGICDIKKEMRIIGKRNVFHQNRIIVSNLEIAAFAFADFLGKLAGVDCVKLISFDPSNFIAVYAGESSQAKIAIDLDKVHGIIKIRWTNKQKHFDYLTAWVVLKASELSIGSQHEMDLQIGDIVELYLEPPRVMVTHTTGTLCWIWPKYSSGRYVTVYSYKIIDNLEDAYGEKKSSELFEKFNDFKWALIDARDKASISTLCLR